MYLSNRSTQTGHFAHSLKRSAWRISVLILSAFAFSFIAVTTVGAARLYAPIISATKTDSFVGTHDGDGKADPGETIQYNVVVNNTGADPATGVTFTDTIDSNTSIVPSSANVSPLAGNDTYATIGNTLLEVGVTASGSPAVRVTTAAIDSLFDNDIEFLGDTFTLLSVESDTVAPFTTATESGGSVTVETDGNFSYTPPVGFSGADHFDYVITDDGAVGSGALTGAGRVTINVNSQEVWYVKNDAAAGGLGRSTDPFDTLVEAQTASSANDTIYVFTGSGSTTNQNAGITLKNGQRLIGEGVELVVPVGLIHQGVGGPNPTSLRVAGSRPHIGNAAGDGVTLSTVSIGGSFSGVEIRGLDISGTGAGTNAVDVTTGSTFSGSFELSDNVISAAGAEGVDVNGGGSGTLTVNIHDTTVTATGNGIDIQRTAGNVNIIAFDDNVVTGATGGTGINIVGTGASVLFDTDPGTATYNGVAGGGTVIGTSGAGNGVGGAGMVLNNVRGDLIFVDLDVYTENGAALSVTGTNSNFAASGTGTRVIVNTGTPTLVAVGGPALSTSQTNINIVPTTFSSTNSTSTGVSLVETSGTLTVPTGSSISNATGVDFFVDGNAVSTATVSATYNGTITDDTGSLVQIVDVTGGSPTYAFTGAITDNNDGDGSGITLTNNDSATIRFSGGLLLSTGSNAAFAATGGAAAVEVCDENPCNPAATGALVNTLTSTTGTALNVANTTIGANNLEFKSISSNGSASGIVLNSTGSSGGLKVKGDGNTSVGGNSSGGTIQNTTSHGISLTNTQHLSFTNMNLQNNADSGIFGTQVVNFTFDNGTINNSGTSLGAFDSNIAFSDGGVTTGTSFVSGIVTITDSILTLGYYDGVDIQNFIGTISDLNISNNTITSSTSTASSKAPGIRVLAYGSASAAASVTKATIDGNTITNFPSDSGIMFQCGNANEGSPSSTCGSGGVNLIAITNNDIAGASAANRIGTQGILANVNGTGTGTFNISGNNISFTAGNSISNNVFGDAIVVSTISNNTVVKGDTANTTATSSIVGGVGDTGGFTTNNPSWTATISNNNLSGHDGNGILLVARENAVSDADFEMTLKITGNTVAAPLGGARPGIRVDAGNGAGDDDDVALEISGNTSGGSSGSAGIGVRKQGTVANINEFGIEGLSPSPANETQTENHISSLNPGSALGTGALGGPSRTLVINGSNFTSTVVAFAPSHQRASVGTGQDSAVALNASASHASAPKTFATASSAGKFSKQTSWAKASKVALLSSSLNSGNDQLISAKLPAPAESGEIVTVPTFTLPAGKSITVVFQVTVNNPLPQNATKITNQGKVSSNELADVFTTNGGTVNCEVGTETCTPIDLVDLSVSKSNNTSNTVVRGTDFAWQIQVSNVAASRDAIFTNGQVVLEDHLPGTVTYDAPSVVPTGGVIGLPNCSITTNVLTCTAGAGGLTIPSGEAVAVALTVHTAAAVPGPLVNPTGGVCQVDPNVVFAEVSTANNSCSNTVTVIRPNTTVVSLTRTDSNPNNTSSVGWQIVFANPVSGVTASNFSVIQGGSVTGATIDSVGTAIQASEPDTTWNITVDTGTGDGTLGLNFVNDTGMDYAVTNAPITGQVYTIDKTAPTVSGVTYNTNTGCLGSSPYYCNAGDTVQINVAFNENVDVDTTGGTPSLALNSGGTATYLSGTGSSTLVFEYTVSAGQNASDLDYTSTSALSLNGGTIQDTATNNATLTLASPGASGSLGNNANVVIDTIAPIATNFNRSNPSTTPTNADTLIWQAIFSEDVSGVSADGSDFTVPALTGETISVSSVNASTYDISVSGGNLANFNGLVDLDFASSPTITDLAGNPLTNTVVGFDQHYMMDNTAPTVSMASAASNPTNTSPIPVTVTFSESVTGFTAGDITTGNGTVSNFAGSGAIYTFDLTPSSEGLVTADIAAGIAQDDGGNPNTAATQFSRTYDITAPSVSMSSTATSPTGTSPIPVDVTFSESVTGFAIGDIVAGNATVSNFSGSGANYSFDLTPSGDGVVTADIAGSVATDLAGNPNTAASQFSIIYDTVAPSVTINQAAGQVDPTSASPINFTVVFSEAVTGFGDLASDVTLSGTAGATTAVVTEITPNNGTTYNVAVSGMSGFGTVIADIPAGAANDLASQPNTASTSTDKTVTFLPPADLSITKTDGVTTAVPGGSVTYTITASNAGPSAAPGSTVTDTFPGILTASWTCVGAGGGTCTAGPVSGNINDTVNLPAGGSVTYTVSATISSSATGTLVNTATVSPSSSVGDANTANNSATDTDTLAPQADLAITKTDGVTTALPGGSITYTITASNTGLSDASSVTVADTFPASLTANWTCVGAGGGTCTAGPVSGNISDTTVNLPAGGSVTYTVSATISPSATGTLSNTATVSSGVTDPNPANNSATDSDTLTPQADLSITKTDGVTVVIPGGSTTYTITASNAGPSNASGATVADTFPASLTASWTCVGAGGGTCTAGPVSGNISDTVNLPAGGSVTYTVSATVSGAASGTISNTATVAAPGSVTDPVPGNNSATDNDMVVPPVSVTINQKTSAPAQSDPTNATSINFTVVFGSSVTDFDDASDVSLSGIAGATTVVITGGPTTYNVAVSGMTGDGTVIATIPANVATGSSGQPNAASTSTDNTVTYDGTAPDTTITSNPSNPTNSTSATFAFDGTDGVDDTFECQIDGGGFSGCSSARSYSGLSEGSHTFQVRAIDAVGNVDPTPASYTWLIDLTAPNTIIDTNPNNPSNSSTANFTFHGTDVSGSGIGSVECRLDSGSFVACDTLTSQAYTGLSEGSHTIQIRAIDNAGNTDATPASYTWVVDTVEPTTTILTNPTNPSASASATFTFNGTDTGGSGVTGFQCQIDGGGFSACNTGTKSYSGLADGSHTFDVRAVDAAGNSDSTPASFTWTIDATAPNTIIDTNPTTPTNSTSATFTFHGDDGTGVGGMTYQCKLDTGSFTTCSSGVNYTSLSNGSHTFQVRATDSLGNTDATPASYTWVVDTVVPTVVVSSVTTSPTNISPIVITITFSEAVTGFTPTTASGDIVIGGVGGTASNPTGSGTTYSFDLTPSGQGAVTVQVPAGSAQDAATNMNTVSNTFSITYDTVAPTVTINQAGTQSDPTSLSPINFTVVFNEAIKVATFTGTDVTLAGTAGATTAVVTQTAPMNGTTFNVAVSGMTASGTVIASIQSAKVTDVAGNNNTASTSTDNTVTFDATPLTVTINQAITQTDPDFASSATKKIHFTAVFSEPVTGFTGSDISFAGTTLMGTLTASVTQIAPLDGTTYDVAVKGMLPKGTVFVSIPANSATSIARGVGNQVSTSTDNNIIVDYVLVEFMSTDSKDGWVLESTETSGTGGSLDSTSTVSRVGDNASDQQYRSVLDFATGSLPDSAVLFSVNLRVIEHSITGTNPFTTHGALKLDVKSGFFGTASALQNPDFEAAPDKSACNFESVPEILEAIGTAYRCIVFESAFPHINLTGSTQFKMRFATDDNDDMSADIFSFYTGDYGGATQRPRLFIKYYIPPAP